MRGRQCVFSPFGKPITVEGTSFGGAREMYCNKVYFGKWFRMDPRDVVVDIGAGGGEFAVLAATHAERVVATEAQSELLTICRQGVGRFLAWVLMGSDLTVKDSRVNGETGSLCVE